MLPNLLLQPTNPCFPVEEVSKDLENGENQSSVYSKIQLIQKFPALNLPNNHQAIFAEEIVLKDSPVRKK